MGRVGRLNVQGATSLPLLLQPTLRTCSSPNMTHTYTQVMDYNQIHFLFYTNSSLHAWKVILTPKIVCGQKRTIVIHVYTTDEVRPITAYMLAREFPSSPFF